MYNLTMPHFPFVTVVEDFARCVFTSAFPKELPFHNLNYTKEVVHTSLQIGCESHIGRDEMELLLTAAWLQSLGYAKHNQDPEQKSVEIAKVFFTGMQLEKERVENIERTIRSTAPQEKPLSEVEKILHDAILFYLASSDYSQYSEKLKNEIETNLNKTFTIKEWINWNIQLLEGHHFCTAYGKEVLEPKKIENLRRQKVCYKVYDDLTSHSVSWAKSWW